MQIEPIWGLQRLKKSLRGMQKEEFSELEIDFLDLLHRQKLYPNNETLNAEREKFLEKFEILAQNSMHRSFASICLPSSANSSTQTSSQPDSFFQPLPKDSETRFSSLPKSTISLLTEIIPIAYGYHYDEREYPLISFKIDNTHKQSTDITCNIEAYFEGYGDHMRQHLSMLAGCEYEVSLLPVIGKETMADIKEPCPATLHVDIQYLLPFLPSASYTKRVQFLPRNIAILWYYKEDGSLCDCTSCIAAWVTPRHPAIGKLLRAAAELHPKRGFTGYNELGTKEEQPQGVREQVRAIFETLCNELRLTYISSSRFIPPQQDDFIQQSQRVRLPAETIFETGASANCIDGSVLFASLLEQINLQPVIFLRPGHAFVGWHVFEDEPVYEFLETTKIDKGNFELALQDGQEQYERAIKEGMLEKPVSDLFNFARLIDIADCRRENIQPMDW